MSTQSMQDVLQTVSGRSLKEAAALFVAQGEASRKAYVVMAKMIVAIEQRLPKGKKIYPFLAENGARKTDVANGRQLSRVWKDYVDQKSMSEDVFDSLGYMDAVAIHKVANDWGD